MMIAAAVVAIAMTSCSSVGIVGGIYHKVVQPVTATSNIVGTKVGTSKCTSVLGIAAYGNGGINEAAKNAGITKISHVDVKTFSVLELFTIQEFFVYGE